MRAVALAAYRVRMPLLAVATIVLLGSLALRPLLEGLVAAQMSAAVSLGAAILVVGCFALALLGPRLLATPATRTVSAPVRGRWLAVNSPASRVPSHGVRVYGQSHAIDLVFEPTPGSRPDFGGEPMRPAHRYPAFGRPVFAMIDGTVVAASGWRRDHRARSNWFGIAYFFLEGPIREVGGPGFVVGNHVTIRGDDGRSPSSPTCSAAP